MCNYNQGRLRYDQPQTILANYLSNGMDSQLNCALLTHYVSKDHVRCKVENKRKYKDSNNETRPSKKFKSLDDLTD